MILPLPKPEAKENTALVKGEKSQLLSVADRMMAILSQASASTVSAAQIKKAKEHIRKSQDVLRMVTEHDHRLKMSAYLAAIHEVLQRTVVTEKNLKEFTQAASLTDELKRGIFREDSGHLEPRAAFLNLNIQRSTDVDPDRKESPAHQECYNV